MLNITKNRINKKINKELCKSLTEIESKTSGKKLRMFLITALIALIVIMFLPWTQNIQGGGTVIALKPDQRPQLIYSVIGGQIQEWYVQEGQFVKKNDTIVRISEIKDVYFDPQLIDRSAQQVQLKEEGIRSYENKIQALENQVLALQSTRNLKLEQTQNYLRQCQLKVTTDSVDFETARINFQIAEDQYNRMKDLHAQGLKSTTDLENRNVQLQKANSTFLSSENKLLINRNELLNAQIEMNSVRAQYDYEIAKAISDKNSAVGMKLDASMDYTKMQNQLSNYEIRNSKYYILAPQDGYVTKALKSGIGELVKEGEALVSIMPAKYDLAVEMYIDPIDLPLVSKGEKVRVQFDGWPAIVFSGWPNSSYGTYGGLVYAIDNFISPNGKYRLLVVPDPEEEAWPEALRPGSAAANMILLNDVPVIYELWRKINGFPPDYYRPVEGRELKNQKAE